MAHCSVGDGARLLLGYLFVFGIVLVIVALAVRATEWLPHARRVVPLLALAGAVSAIAIIPLSIPYQRAANQQGMVRSLDNVTEYSATPAGYLAASGRLHLSTWGRPFFHDPVNSFSPGVVVTLLAAVAIVRMRPRKDISRQRVIMLALIALVGFVLSLGPHAGLRVGLPVFPPMQGLRVASIRKSVPACDVRTCWPRPFTHLADAGVATRSGTLRTGARCPSHGDGQPGIAARADRVSALHRHSGALSIARDRRESGPRGGAVLSAAGGVENAEYVLNSTPIGSRS